MGKIICLITGEEAYAGNGGYTCRSISLLISYTTNVLIQNTDARMFSDESTKKKLGFDIVEETKLKAKLAEFSTEVLFKPEKFDNSDVIFPEYKHFIGEKFLNDLKKEPFPSLEKRIELFLNFLRNIDSKITKLEERKNALNLPNCSLALKPFFCAISYTENRDWKNFIHYLEEKKKFIVSYPYLVTTEGLEFLQEKRKNQESKKVFVAMWFNEKVDFIYEQAVEPAIRECNYEPERIDRVEHNNIIDDEIIANIKQSKFIIADFTAEKDKPRGGVYYEAGFADGLGIPVIFTCRKDLIENKEIHFDLEHRNFIWWEENKMEDFKKKLIKRIKATID